MHRTTLTWLTRLGRWPTRLRRVAALGCLLLAVATALHPAGRTAGATASERPAASANPLTRQLGDGEVAAPLSLDGPSPEGFLRPGDRIDLYAGRGGTSLAGCPATGPVARGVRVLAVRSGRAGLGTATAAQPVIVALDEAAAARLADLHTCAIYAVLRR